MTLGGTVNAMLPGLRAIANSMMHESIKVEVVGVPTLNPTTLKYTAGAASVVYSGPANVRARQDHLTAEGGGHTFTVTRFEMKVPFGAEGVDKIKPGAVVTITASPDAALVDRTFRVTLAVARADATAARFSLEDLG